MAVLTSIAASVFGHRLRRRVTYLIGFLIGGAPRFLVLAVDVPLSAVIVVFVISGMGIGVLNPIITAVTLERLPQSMVGRGSALISSLAWAGIPFGGMVSGGLISMFALSPALLTLGAGYLLATLVPALAPTWKQMDQRPPDSAAGNG
ncbi:MFS transporter [Nesterenkonia muleiensis]|uniref:MFS transporter n=1 Tax=Nesterenkonia muleiensis TaxID=2282648 RepID=UPI0013001BC3|nr:MFS transporter [Nesterenkonia muleiensis]